MRGPLRCCPSKSWRPWPQALRKTSPCPSSWSISGSWRAGVLIRIQLCSLRAPQTMLIVLATLHYMAVSKHLHWCTKMPKAFSTTRRALDCLNTLCLWVVPLMEKGFISQVRGGGVVVASSPSIKYGTSRSFWGNGSADGKSMESLRVVRMELSLKMPAPDADPLASHTCPYELIVRIYHSQQHSGAEPFVVEEFVPGVMWLL